MDRKALEKLLRRVLEAAGAADASADVFVLADGEMKALASRTLYPKELVDVLAFEAGGFPSPEKPGRYLGEVYVNRRFLKDGKYFAFLLAHGVAHLLGFRHEGKNDTILMKRLEKKILNHLRDEGIVRDGD